MCRWLMLALLLALATPSAADPLDPPSDRDPDSEGHHERSWPERPHYLPSWERTDRGYVPSYQHELERRKRLFHCFRAETFLAVIGGGSIPSRNRPGRQCQLGVKHRRQTVRSRRSPRCVAGWLR